MREILVQCAGIYMILLVIFHLLFWRLFNWPESLMPLDNINRSTMQVLNLGLTFLFGIIAYISLLHTTELLTTALGNSLLILLSLLWLFRAVLQVVFYGVRHPASTALTLYFVVGALLFGLPGFM